MNEDDLEFFGSRDEVAEQRTVAARRRLRNQLAADVEAFLAKGGKINEVDIQTRADMPQKPGTDYGSRPI